MNNTSYIHAGWLIDGTGGPIQEKVLITIAQGRVKDIEPFSSHLGLEPAEITDLSHCTILPPLVDSHVHLFMSGTTDRSARERQLVAGYDELRPIIAQHLHYLFSHGVLAARDGGDRGGFAQRYRSEKQMHPALQLKVAGRAWHKRERYGSLIGRYPGEAGLLYDVEQEQDGADFVKLVNSGLNSLKIYGKETSAQFSLDEVTGLVKAAAANSQKVMVHANGKEPVAMAIAAGCHSIEHGFFMGRENLQRLADSGTFWVPTVFTMKAYGKNLSRGEDGVDHQVIEKNVLHQMEQLQLARELGVEVALGTDAGSLGVLHGESMMEEMKLFKRAGYSLSETIRCATANGARLLGLDDPGEIRPGNRATFLVSRGAPSQLPRKLTYLEKIFIDGSESPYYRKNPVKHIR